MGPFIHNIDPIFGQIGAFHLWWYGLSYTLGFLALFHWFRTVREPLGLDVPQVYDLTILIAAGVLIGGRAVEVIFYEWAYYSQHLTHILWIWLGGMSTHGILLGGTLGTWLFCRLRHKNFLSLADELVVPAAFIMGLGRMGNFIDGQIVGSVTDAWWAVKFPDTEGFRHPVVLYDGVKNLMLVPVLLLVRRIKPPRGVMLGTFLFGYGFFRIIIDYFREYRTELLGLPPGQEFNIAMSIGGIILIMWAVRKNYPRVKPLADDAVRSGFNIDIRKATRTKRNILRALLLIPLIIPSDWTQDVYQRYGNRHAGIITSDWYPAINRNDEKEP
ncbi:MAG: prolipoprotein diacylglyceryl transferase [Sedimenticolaceae bacterium]